MEEAPMDNYSLQIAYLNKHPKKITQHWMRGDGLFAQCGPNQPDGYNDFGCLTMVKAGSWEAYTEELTERIRNDERVPNCVDNTADDLEVFAEYQREIDTALGRTNTFPAEILFQVAETL